MASNRSLAIVAVAIGLSLLGRASGEDWAQFRGGPALGQANAARLPIQWAGRSGVAWRTALPGAGWSQPIVVGGRIYVTTAVGPGADDPSGMGGVMSFSTWGMAATPKAPIQWRVICLDPEDGAILWSRSVAESVPTFAKHASNTYATETPCGSASAIFAFFGGTGTLLSLDREGNERWRREFGPQAIQNQFGTGSSPVLHTHADGDRLLVQLYNEDVGRLHCLRATDGADLWTADREKGTAWSTPIVWSNGGTSEVVTAGQGAVIAYALETGEERWRVGGLDTSFACSLVGDPAAVYCGTSSPGSRAPLFAVAAGHHGDLSLPRGRSSSAAIPWSRTKSGAGMPSPLVVGDFLYFFGDKAVCYDKRTGAEQFRKRMPDGTTAVGCPIVVGDRIYVVNEKGKTIVIDAGKEFRVLAESPLDAEGEIFWASPAVTADSLLVRSSRALYCIRAKTIE